MDVFQWLLGDITIDNSLGTSSSTTRTCSRADGRSRTWEDQFMRLGEAAWSDDSQATGRRGWWGWSPVYKPVGGPMSPWCRAATSLRLDVGLLGEEGQQDLYAKLDVGHLGEEGQLDLPAKCAGLIHAWGWSWTAWGGRATGPSPGWPFVSRVKFCKVGGGVFHGDPFSPPGFLFERFSKDNISNVSGRIVPKPADSAMRKMAGNSCLPNVANWVTEPWGRIKTKRRLVNSDQLFVKFIFVICYIIQSTWDHCCGGTLQLLETSSIKHCYCNCSHLLSLYFGTPDIFQNRMSIICKELSAKHVFIVLESATSEYAHGCKSRKRVPISHSRMHFRDWSWKDKILIKHIFNLKGCNLDIGHGKTNYSLNIYLTTWECACDRKSWKRTRAASFSDYYA